MHLMLWVGALNGGHLLQVVALGSQDVELVALALVVALAALAGHGLIAVGAANVCPNLAFLFAYVGALVFDAALRVYGANLGACEHVGQRGRKRNGVACFGAPGVRSKLSVKRLGS